LTSLSGGEYQRLLLAKQLMHPQKQKCLYIFDEPAAGLHPFDIEKLNVIFLNLAENGHSVVIIEHNPTMTAIADQVLELGPVGGPEGGYILKNHTSE
ncbi:MAG TPA: excinuclease ABC subunit A, partial [Bacteroidales bacterium]|nr:excinuclease ABC subunit A [Bacteroidales bacterium]